MRRWSSMLSRVVEGWSGVLVVVHIRFGKRSMVGCWLGYRSMVKTLHSWRWSRV